DPEPQLEKILHIDLVVVLFFDGPVQVVKQLDRLLINIVLALYPRVEQILFTIKERILLPELGDPLKLAQDFVLTLLRLQLDVFDQLRTLERCLTEIGLHLANHLADPPLELRQCPHFSGNGIDQHPVTLGYFGNGNLNLVLVLKLFEVSRKPLVFSLAPGGVDTEVEMIIGTEPPRKVADVIAKFLELTEILVVIRLQLRTQSDNRALRPRSRRRFNQMP